MNLKKQKYFLPSRLRAEIFNHAFTRKQIKKGLSDHYDAVIEATLDNKRTTTEDIIESLQTTPSWRLMRLIVMYMDWKKGKYYSPELLNIWLTKLDVAVENILKEEHYRELSEHYYVDMVSMIRNVLATPLGEHHVSQVYNSFRTFITKNPDFPHRRIPQLSIIEVFFHHKALNIQKQVWNDNKEEIVNFLVSDANEFMSYCPNQNWGVIRPDIKVEILEARHKFPDLEKWKRENPELWRKDLNSCLLKDEEMDDIPLEWLEELVVVSRLYV